MSDQSGPFSDLHDPDLLEPGGPRRQIQGRVLGGLIMIILTIIVIFVVM